MAAFLPPPPALGDRPPAGAATVRGGRPPRGGPGGWPGGAAVWRRAAGASPCTSPPLCPPLIRGRSLAVSYTAAATAAAAAITAAAAAGATRLTVDVPPSRAESRAGTLVGRYEADLSFAGALLTALGAVEGPAGWARVGEDVEIRHCVNPQGGGDYLTEEGLWGVVGEATASAPGGGGGGGGLTGTVTVLGNAGVDVAALAGVGAVVAASPPAGVVVLLNGGASRVTWLDRLGWGRGRAAAAAALDAFVPAYALARIGGDGVMGYAWGGEWTVWKVRGGGGGTWRACPFSSAGAGSSPASVTRTRRSSGGWRWPHDPGGRWHGHRGRVAFALYPWGGGPRWSALLLSFSCFLLGFPCFDLDDWVFLCSFFSFLPLLYSFPPLHLPFSISLPGAHYMQLWSVALGIPCQGAIGVMGPGRDCFPQSHDGR